MFTEPKTKVVFYGPWNLPAPYVGTSVQFHFCFVKTRAKQINSENFSLTEVKPFLPFQDSEKVIYSLISSHLDYWNSLCMRVSQSSLSRLLYVQNTAWFLMGFHKHEHHSPVLSSLPMLPVIFRIHCITPYTVTHPGLSELLTSHSWFSARLSISSGVTVPSQLQALGCGANCPTTLDPPPSSESFKTQLKGHLLSLAFECH